MATRSLAVSAKVLAEVATGGASDAGGLPIDLLGDFLSALANAVTAGKPLNPRQMTTYRGDRRQGRSAIADLVETLLAPLREVRGGSGRLLDTLAAYVASGSNAALTARQLHLSGRAVTYRLDRVRRLTDLDPARAGDQFSLHVAVLGAKLLGWPDSPLS